MLRTSLYEGSESFTLYRYELGSEAMHRPNPSRGKSHHQCCTSESNILEKPPWFEDLLDEPDNSLLASKGHRRSASDSSMYVSALAYQTHNTKKEKTKFQNHIPYKPQTSVPNDESMWKVGIEKTQSPPNPQYFEVGEPSLISEICFSGTDGNSLETLAASSTITKKHDQEKEVASKNKEGRSGKSSLLQTKPSVLEQEDKCTKQCWQSAHWSRIWKLQYIADLERNIQVLQVKGCEVSAALEFLDQQKFILGMENRALRQRLDSLSQEHMIKQMEQEMLEREIARLQALHQLQMHQQPQHHPKKNRDQLSGQLAQPLYDN